MENITIYAQTDSIYADAERIVDVTQKQAFHAVDRMLILRNWLLGKRIFEEELKGEDRAKYGAEVIAKLSKYLNNKYGKGFSTRNLWEDIKFYKAYPEIVHTPCAQSALVSTDEILHTLCAEFKKLSWSHYRILIQVIDKPARDWYEQEAEKEMWSVKKLQRKAINLRFGGSGIFAGGFRQLHPAGTAGSSRHCAGLLAYTAAAALRVQLAISE